MERETGLEPATYGLEGHRSSQLSYSRTFASWSGRKDLNLRPPAPKAGALTRLRYAPDAKITGGAEGSRTPYLFRAREARSQLRYSPSKPLRHFSMEVLLVKQNLVILFILEYICGE